MFSDKWVTSGTSTSVVTAIPYKLSKGTNNDIYAVTSRGIGHACLPGSNALCSNDPSVTSVDVEWDFAEYAPDMGITSTPTSESPKVFITLAGPYILTFSVYNAGVGDMSWLSTVNIDNLLPDEAEQQPVGASYCRRIVSYGDHLLVDDWK
jgi:hypothetical protein